MRKAKGKPRLWGLHNYQDVNRRTSADTRLMLSLVPGEVWLTETGGIVKFQGFKFSTSRAAKRTKWMFTLANRYDSRQRGLRSKVTQLLVYRWFGEPRGARFDAGLVGGLERARQLHAWREQALPAYLTTVERWKVTDLTSAPGERLLAGVRELALADRGAGARPDRDHDHDGGQRAAQPGDPLRR
jgi:hypothetical protein